MFDRSLSRDEWQTRRAAYLARVRTWAEDRLRRTSRREKHPVYDFLFEYYSFRPAYLLRWSPGFGIRLEEATSDDLDWRQGFTPCDGGQVLPGATFPRHRIEYLRWATAYLAATAAREPAFGCFGLHEWAMVYQETNVRHGRVPLRLSRAETEAVVDSAAVKCTHFDAFRFFTAAAVPLNRIALTRATTTAHDQAGCVHVNMDLYKFAFVVAPYTSSEILADAFDLARAARELDMRASPYDLTALGFAPIRIETRDGREEYIEKQREIYQQGTPVRERVLAEYRRLASVISESKGTNGA
ncbi:3-methyladenine DNA glycosylase [Fimbriiglobus ruber]|uniref:3-methyladenine DNA glycosylase n=1 Tax=Fimbriiglobus ruber TaxID=1908690 RepID=A0A225DZP9_9BACT|nr:3-methyladenine DNA glycosylase [Fimbriiglobus ruber]OWK46970.1 hypothetical protein FRUB_00669 [Fimbriiglobus ruber]